MATNRVALALAVVPLVVSSWATFVACGDDAGAGDVPVMITVSGVPASADPGSALAGLQVAVVRAGKPAAGVELTLTAVAGGGSVAPTALTTDSAGHASFIWTVGQLPVENVLAIAESDAPEVSASVTVDVPTGGALTAETFADVDAFLTANAIEGSTEDLAFSPSGQLVMGVPGHLLTVTADGTVAFLPAGGEPLLRPLGLAFDKAGKLWIADGDANALMVYEPGTPTGTIRKVVDHDGDEAFDSPNDVAVGHDGRVYLSDTCTGKVYAIDPASGEVIDRVAFDHVSEGGPNGLVVGPGSSPGHPNTSLAGSNDLFVTTENTALFCGHQDVEVTAPVAGLFRVGLGETGFGERKTVAAGVAVFGDGLAFDDGGNLYVLFDTAVGFALDETIVHVLPFGKSELRRAFAAKGKVWANLAFGNGAFGDTTMYLSLLKLPPFTQSRGVERVQVGVYGAPLPPE